MDRRTQTIILVLIPMFLAFAAGCGGGKSSSGNAVLDNLPPAIVSLSPGDGAADVDVMTGITITFSEPMSRNVVEKAFTLTPKIPGRFIWSNNDSVLTFKPDQPLAFHNTYTMSVTNGADRAGNVLSAAASAGFITAGAASVPVTNIAPPAVTGDARLDFNGKGDAVASWLTDTSGVTDLHYSFRDATTGQWSTPQSVMMILEYRIASDGTDFMLTWADSSGIHASTIITGAASVPVDISVSPGHQLQLVSNGSGYVLAWTSDLSSGNLFASVYAAGWSAVESFTCSGTTLCYTPGSFQLASNGTGYAIAWLEPGFQSDIMSYLYQDNGAGTDTWTGPQIVDAGVNSQQISLVLTSSGQGYAAAWHILKYGINQTFEVHANIQNGTSWGIAKRLDTSGDATDPVIASDGNGYAVAWRHKDIPTGISDLSASLYNDDGGVFAWTNADVLASVAGDVSPPRIDSNGQGYAVAWTESAACTDCGQDVHARIYDSGVWGNDVMLNTSELPATGVTLNNEAVQLVTNGQGYAAAWLHQDSSSGRSLKMNTFDNNLWGGESVVEAADPDAALLTVNNGFYAAIWSRAVSSGMDVMVNVAF